MKKTITALVILLTMLCSTIFASAAADPAVTIVNPGDETMVYSDSLLVSIKVTQPKTIRVSVMEKKQSVNGVDTSIDVNKMAAASTDNNTTEAAIAADLVKNAKNVEVGSAEKFTCTNNLSFFTKQVNDLTPGMYLVKVETLDGAGKAVYSSSSMVALMGKKTPEQEKLIESPKNGAFQFFQDLFKNLFT